jgi:3-dehydroquinate dehydratase-2
MTSGRHEDGTRGKDKEDLAGLTPTVTLAKLYEGQGFLEKAASVYKRLLVNQPGRVDVREALEAIEKRLAGVKLQRAESETTDVPSQRTEWRRIVNEGKKMLDQRGEQQRKVLVIHGPNLNMLGRREPSVYGTSTLEEIDEEIKKTAAECGLRAETFQSNREGDLVEKIHKAIGSCDVLIINPAAYTHTSIALRDALLMLDIPIIEVHLSNIHRREAFRKESMIADVVTAQVVGFGKDGYAMAVRAAATMLGGVRDTSRNG